MIRNPAFGWTLFVAAAVLTCIPVLAQTDEPGDGQADLEAATSLKLSASSMADLERVIELCESAIEKGLDDESKQLATSLATATLFQHGSRFAQALFDPQKRPQRPQLLKRFALTDLYKVLEYDDTLPQVHMMIARLEAVNVGRTITQEAFKKGLASADRAIELLADDNETRSKAYVLRAAYARSGKERMELLDQAIDSDSKNTDAWRLRGKNRLVEGELLAATGQLEKAKTVREQAVSDFEQLLEQNPDDPDALQAVAELLSRLGNNEEALARVDRAIDKNPGAPSLFILRGRIYHEEDRLEDAIKDLNRAIDLQPDSHIAFLDRMEVHFSKNDLTAASKDYGRARDLQGTDLVTTALQRITIRAQGDFEKAIEGVLQYIEIDDANAEDSGRIPDPEYRIRLGTMYVGITQPRNAIQVLSDMLDHLGTSRNRRLRGARVTGLRNRADAFLSVGDHQKAITDYESAIKLDPNEDGALNNLAWVLATSPEDELRDGKKAIELATNACKVTDYKQAHILSTLAAGYAEAGDFEKAIEWSSKAVEMGQQGSDPETLKQLQAELESYKQEKPWRELQDVTKDASDDDSES